MGRQLLDHLKPPRRTLVFCDDTDIAAGVPWLRPDLRILVAVEMSSERYAPAAAGIEAALERLGMPEFHATELANPKKSPWRNVSAEGRVEALRFLADLFNSTGARVYQARIPKDQFVTLKARAQRVGKVGVGFKHGLKRVFLRCLFDHLEAQGGETVVVMDQDRNLVEPVVEDWPEGRFLVGGGPIAARSVDVPGLQLADLAAWSINRMLRRRPCFDDGTATDVDRAALEVVGNLNGGLGDLLALSAAVRPEAA